MRCITNSTDMNSSKLWETLRIKTIRTACGILIFVMGIFIAQKLGSRFVNHDFGDYAIATFQVVKNVFDPKMEEEVLEEVQTGDEESTWEYTAGELPSETSEKVEETVSYPKPLYYIVKKGDTLAAISRKMYSSDRYTGQIAEANNLSDADEIYEGQKILIPSIE